MSQYFFFPWVRSGAASFIAAQDNPGETLPNRASINAGVRINKLSGQFDIERKLRLYGPGDVTGLDPRQVIRTDPLHLTTDFEPNYLVSIEFDRPDLPWLFTPASAGDKVRPARSSLAVHPGQRRIPGPFAALVVPGGGAQAGRGDAQAL